MTWVSDGALLHPELGRPGPAVGTVGGPVREPVGVGELVEDVIALAQVRIVVIDRAGLAVR